MANSCVYMPKEGKDLFTKLRSKLDYKTAKDVFLISVSPEFKQIYKDTLTLDSEGIPSYESVINNPLISKRIGTINLVKALSRLTPDRENTRENYNYLLDSAYHFNTTNPNNGKLTAVVQGKGDGKIGIIYKDKSESSLKEFKNQYSIRKLNQRLASLLKPIGITIGNLEAAEVKAGRVGVTDFSNVRKLGESIVSVIEVANNIEGEKAVSEEFSHLIIGTFANEPIVSRSLSYLQDHPEEVEKILGDSYEDTLDFYDDNEDLVAEEALGQILQKNLLKAQEEIQTPVGIFKKLYSWVKNKFKGINRDSMIAALDDVDASMSSLAKDLLRGTRVVDQTMVKAAQREVKFNALSDEIARNIKILKDAINTEIKKEKILKSPDKETYSNRRDLINNLTGKTAKIKYKDSNTVEEVRQMHSNVSIEVGKKGSSVVYKISTKSHPEVIFELTKDENVKDFGEENKDKFWSVRMGDAYSAKMTREEKNSLYSTISDLIPTGDYLSTWSDATGDVNQDATQHGINGLNRIGELSFEKSGSRRGLSRRFGEDVQQNATSIAIPVFKKLNVGEVITNYKTVEGIFNYAESALSQLRKLESGFDILKNLPLNKRFSFLRKARMYTQSYGTFIREMKEALVDEEKNPNSLLLGNVVINGQEVKLADVIKDLSQLSESLTIKYSRASFTSFAEFMKPFFGNEIVVPFGKMAGTKMTVDSLLKEAQTDITFVDRWLQSMGDSSDIVLQVFNEAVGRANEKARRNSIEFINKVHLLREKAEKLGIKTYDWMFEVDRDGNKTGNYISQVNIGQFQIDFNNLIDSLDEKYGKNPKGDDAKKKLLEKRTWLQSHAQSIYGELIPNSSIYKNPAYDNMSNDQLEIYKEFMSLKESMDQKYPANKIYGNRAIQMRKGAAERLYQNLSSPSQIFENIKESVKSTFTNREDDDQLFGNNMVTGGLTDFNNNEFCVLPILYNSPLKNPNDLSTDIIGSLMAYGYSSLQYEQLDKIVDALEVGKTLVEEDRQVLETRGSKKVVEKLKSNGETKLTEMLNTNPYIVGKLNDFMECQVYHRYLKPGGNILDSNINANKLVSFLLKGSSLAQLGFNYLANLANVATGLSMQNIEAVANQFFGAKELIKADGIYFGEVGGVTAEYAKRNKTSKLGLFFELFSIKQDFEANTKRAQTYNNLTRLFGKDIAFLGQGMGDHWLYGRAAIAMAIREKVLLNGEEMSLWDALKVEDVKGSDSLKKLSYENIKNLDGTAFDTYDFFNRVKDINKNCFGAYSDADSNAANRVIMGRLLMQYRKWMTVQYSVRFRSGHYNMATKTWTEGYYRTMGRYLMQLKRGGFQISATYKNLTVEEQSNIKRALFEIGQFFAVWAIANLIKWPDDKKRPWALKLAEYSAKRLQHELGGLTLWTTMPQEILKTAQSPIPLLNPIRDVFNLANSAVDPRDWNNEISSGPYKGMSTLEKNFIKAPLPIVAQYRQIDKFVGDLDNSINYYVRPW